jgi:hypothetical protein
MAGVWQLLFGDLCSLHALELVTSLAPQCFHPENEDIFTVFIIPALYPLPSTGHTHTHRYTLPISGLSDNSHPIIINSGADFV